MPPFTPIETPRLILRPWRDADREPFAALNADPIVMRHFPQTIGRDASDAFIDRMIALAERNGYSFAAIESRADGAFLGMAGIGDVNFDAPFGPAVEIGWRLPRYAWGRGIASEAARAWLRYGFTTAGLESIVSFTATTNERSEAVMRRIGMVRAEPPTFDHPLLPDDHPLRRHVLYVITQHRWANTLRHPQDGDVIRESSGPSIRRD